MLKDLLRGANLCDEAVVHDGDAVCDIPDGRDVVSDDEVRELQILLEGHKVVQHLGLDRDIERACGLVKNQQLRADAQRPSQ